MLNNNCDTGNTKQPDILKQVTSAFGKIPIRWIGKLPIQLLTTLLHVFQGRGSFLYCIWQQYARLHLATKPNRNISEHIP